MIKITLNLSKTRELAYLAALRERYNQPTWNLKRLVERALREVYAFQVNGIDPYNPKGDPTDD